jgi:regulator of sigma E protease
MALLQTAWWFLVLIGVMILLHELGHYLMARLFDVKVEAFSFGFGPRLFGRRRGETDFRVCAFPMGGYVKMAGEQPGEEGAADPRAFPSKPRWQRLLIIFAGPAVNAVLAVALLTGLYMFEYMRLPNPPNPIVGTVSKGGAAERAGIREGDRVVRFDGQVNPTWETIQIKEIASARQALDVWVEREGQRMNFTLIPDYNEAQGMGNAGWGPQLEVQIAGFCCGVDVAEKAGLRKGDAFVSINGQPIRSSTRLLEILDANQGNPAKVVYRREGVEYETTVTPVWNEYEGSKRWRIGAALQPSFEILQLPPAEAFREAVRQNTQYATLLYKFLQGMIAQRMSARNLEGPIGIARLSGEAASRGAADFLGLMAMVSMNLAVINLLPIPLLDGGGILMLLIEMLMQRDLSLRVKEAVVKIGLVFIMALVVFVIFNDISKVIPRTPPVKTQQN